LVGTAKLLHDAAANTLESAHFTGPLGDSLEAFHKVMPDLEPAWIRYIAQQLAPYWVTLIYLGLCLWILRLVAMMACLSTNRKGLLAFCILGASYGWAWLAPSILIVRSSSDLECFMLHPIWIGSMAVVGIPAAVIYLALSLLSSVLLPTFCLPAILYWMYLEALASGSLAARLLRRQNNLPDYHS
jgi:hypothetical protein